MGKKNIGERTCIGCGRKAHKGDLLRLVVDEEGRIVVDAKQRAPGRGGYLCRREQCFDQAAKRRRMSVRFRRDVKVDSSSLIEIAREQFRARAGGPERKSPQS
jgi:uncharacterized protein